MSTVVFLGSHLLGWRCLELLDAHDDLTVSVVVTYPRDYDAWWDGPVHERALDPGHDVHVQEDQPTPLGLGLLLSR